MLQTVIHYFLHLLFPALIAFLFYQKKWLKVYALFLLTMLVDLDHLLATPIFDPNRCSIGFHFLHSYPMIAVYLFFLIRPKTRVLALGLTLHMATDLIDCWFNLQ